MTLVEILIALFVFMVGILGVLSLFPVAMRSAGRAIGEVRATIMAESALAQFTADCRIPVESGEPQLSTPSTLKRVAGQKDDRRGYFVTLISGPGKGQSRIITRKPALGNEEVLEICPDWKSVGAWVQPGDGALQVPPDPDKYIITRLGLPPPRTDETIVPAAFQTRDSRSGFVRVITEPNKFRTGKANGNAVDPHTWGPAGVWVTAVPETGTVDSGSEPHNLKAVGEAWGEVPPEHRGKLVILTGPDNSRTHGQVRLITANTATTLDVYPNWELRPQQDDTFEIRANLGYYVLFTSGRAVGRVVPIVNHVTDATDGDEIVFPDDVDLTVFGVTAAERDVDGAPTYDLSRATSFTIIGSSSFIGSAHPNRHPNTLTDQPVLDYTLNGFGPFRIDTAGPPASLGKPSEPQTGQDVFHVGAATENVASDYSAVCIFSDNGSGSASYPATDRWPVRIDVLVFLNFDRHLSLVENKRAVGYMTGYIERP